MILLKIILSSLLYRMAGFTDKLNKSVIVPISKMAQKFLPKNKDTRIFLFLVLIVGLLLWYNREKLPNMKMGMANQGAAKKNSGDASVMEVGVKPVQTSPEEQYTKVQGVSTDTHGLAPSCSGASKVDPSELLPKDKNSEWAKLNPHGSGELSQVSLLKAGHHVGVNTVGNSLRNANLQLRSEPPNPQGNVGPWMQSTIDPDLERRPLE